MFREHGGSQLHRQASCERRGVSCDLLGSYRAPRVPRMRLGSRRVGAAAGDSDSRPGYVTATAYVWGHFKKTNVCGSLSVRFMSWGAVWEHRLKLRVREDGTVSPGGAVGSAALWAEVGRGLEKTLCFQGLTSSCAARFCWAIVWFCLQHFVCSFLFKLTSPCAGSFLLL